MHMQLYSLEAILSKNQSHSYSIERMVQLLKRYPLGWLGLLALTSLSARAQAQSAQPLAGTAWRGIMRVPNPTEVVLQFRQDSLILIEPASREVVEIMAYTRQGDQWTWRKLLGSSPCDDQARGTCRYQISQGELRISVVHDDCPERGFAITEAPFRKVSWPPPATAGR